MTVKEALHRASPELKQIAEETGISYASIKAYRMGKRTPSPENVRKLADALERRGVSLIEAAVRLRDAVPEDEG